MVEIVARSASTPPPRPALRILFAARVPHEGLLSSWNLSRCRGWWLPEHVDNQVPGALTWDPARRGTLRLVGQLFAIVLLDIVLSDGQGQKFRDQ